MLQKKIEDEISDLNQENLFSDNCPSESVRVCFTSGLDCDIVVNYNAGYVDKDGDRRYFHSDSLMYAAVFSEREIYECQLKRVMQRGEQLALLYKDKAQFISRAGCETDLDQDLLELSNLQKNLDDSQDLDGYMINLADDIDTRNNLEECQLW